jgi:hypothetical protein
MTLWLIEASLQNGQLWAAMGNGRYWKLRRNGATQRWKTRPNDYRVPVKAGLKSCGQITHTSSVANILDDANWRSANFVIAKTDPNNAP